MIFHSGLFHSEVSGLRMEAVKFTQRIHPFFRVTERLTDHQHIKNSKVFHVMNSEHSEGQGSSCSSGRMNEHFKMGLKKRGFE
jgi:hypothetical protein